MRPSFTSSAALIAVLLCCARSPAVLRGQAQALVDEQQVKAAYLVGFARFIEGVEPAEIVVCTAGDQEMLEALQRATTGKAVSVLIRAARGIADVHGCTVVFIGAGKMRLLREINNSPTEMRVLTVGDSPRFLDEGGALEFVWSRNRIQFNISVTAVQKSGLRVSSRLLNLARNLRPSGSAQ